MLRPVFVDTSGWVAFFARHDRQHRAAVRAFDALGDAGRELITTDYVVAETVTRLRMYGGAALALVAWDELEGGEAVTMVEIERSHRVAARRLFKKYAEHELSLVDCTSFAVMHELAIQEALTFDADFTKVGFRRLP